MPCARRRSSPKADARPSATRATAPEAVRGDAAAAFKVFLEVCAEAESEASAVDPAALATAQCYVGIAADTRCCSDADALGDVEAVRYFSAAAEFGHAEAQVRGLGVGDLMCVCV